MGYKQSQGSWFFKLYQVSNIVSTNLALFVNIDGVFRII